MHDLAEVVLERGRQPPACAPGWPASRCSASWSPPRQREAGAVGVAVDVVELDGVEALRGAQVEAGSMIGLRTARAGGCRASARRASRCDLPSTDGGELAGVGPPVLPRAGAEVADDVAAARRAAGRRSRPACRSRRRRTSGRPGRSRNRWCPTAATASSCSGPGASSADTRPAARASAWPRALGSRARAGARSSRRAPRTQRPQRDPGSSWRQYRPTHRLALTLSSRR